MATTEGMNPSFASQLTALINASGGRVTIVSGYRSPEKQAGMYAAAVKKYGSEAAARRWVAPPGKSNHGKGIAADLGGDIAWAHAHAAEFGLYFPMAWEDWHIEPLGSRDGTFDDQAYTPDPATGDKPAGPNRNDLGTQLVSMFGLLSGAGDGAMGAPGEGMMGTPDSGTVNVQSGFGPLLGPNEMVGDGEDASDANPSHGATMSQIEQQRQQALGARA